MARTVLVLEEVIALLKSCEVPDRFINRFKERAEIVFKMKPRKEYDNITVTSGRGQASKKGFVELAIDDTQTQMEAVKAKEIGLMLIEASEAAISDEIFAKLLSNILGLDNDEAVGRILLELREIRQGTKGVSFPT